MLLEEVVIKNFCSCSDLSLPLNRFNPIIGCNNSGKSNVLRAINWLLRKSVLPLSSFFDVTHPVIVEGQISGVNIQLLPQNQQNQISQYIVSDKLRFRRRQDSPSSTAAQIKIDIFDQGGDQWVTNPTGLDNAIGVLFPDPLYIEAMEDAAEDVSRFTAKNTIGELLKYTIGQIRSNNAVAMQNIDTALRQLSDHLNGPARIQELSTLESDASQAVGEFFPGLLLHLNIQSPQLDDLVKGATVSLSDRPGSPRPFTSFGHGAQRAVQMALIKLLAANINQNGGNGATIILLIDEPELYLHPQAIELLREALKTLSDQDFQVIFSTHSPLLLGRSDALNSTLMYKGTNGATAARTKLANAAQAIANNPHQASAIFALQNSTYLLFAEKVLVVEGKTEKMILPEVYEVLKGKSLAYDKACIVEAHGSKSIFPMLTVLQSVGYAPKAVVDLDFVFRVAPGVGIIDITNADYIACLNWFAANHTAQGFFLGPDGFPAKNDGAGLASRIPPEEAFELMASQMQREVAGLVLPLQQNNNIWVWSKGAIEAHLGIAKDDQDRIAFLSTMKQSGNVSHAAQPQDIQNFIAWL